MTLISWLRGLTHGSALTLKKSRRSAARARGLGQLAGIERLENRILLSYDFGFAVALGSTGSENSLGVATDTSGNVLVPGSFTSPSIDLDPGPGTYILTNTGLGDGYAAKYDPTGNLLWGVQVAGTGNGSVHQVKVDGAGNVLIAGIFAGSVEIAAPGRPPVTLTNTLPNGGVGEGFLAKFDTAGNALWARTFGLDADARYARSITTDAASNVYATGKDGENRLFVAKYSTDGTAVWTQVVSGAGTLANGTLVYGERVAVDTAGNVLVVGEYGGKIDFNPDPLTTNFLTSLGLHPSGDDVFVLKLNAAGAYVWAGSMGGPGPDIPEGLGVDGAGNILVSGYYGGGPSDFDPGPGTLNLPNTGFGFVVQLDPNRNLIWGHSLAVVNVGDMALDAAGNVYTTGRFMDTPDFDPGPGTFNLTAGGSNDVYVSKLNSSGSFVWAADILAGVPGSIAGNSFGLAVDGSGNVYTTGSFQGTVDFDPGAGTYSLTSTPDSIGNPTKDTFVSKLTQVVLPPPPAALTIGDATVAEGNTGTILVTFVVTRSGDSTQAVTVDYNTGDQSASAGADYAAASGTLIFAAGETSKTINIVVNGDRLVESNETFVVKLSGATNALIADGQGVGTIVDDEPRISINDVQKKEGSKNTTLFTFTITLSNAYDQAVTVNYATMDGSATVSGGDYLSAGGTLTFAPGQTSKTITIQVKADRNREADEMFSLDLFGNSSNSLFTKSRGLGTILNDD